MTALWVAARAGRQRDSALSREGRPRASVEALEGPAARNVARAAAARSPLKDRE